MLATSAISLRARRLPVFEWNFGIGAVASTPSVGLEQFAPCPGAVHRVDDLGHHRNTRDAAESARIGEEFVAEAVVAAWMALAVLHVFGPQHQVRKVDVPGMRRHVGTLGHETHVTQVTVIDHVPVDLLVDAIELQRFTRVDRVKKCREGIAQREATATAVADVEDALEFFLERGLVGKRRVIASPADGARAPAGCPRVMPVSDALTSSIALGAIRSCRGPSGSDWRANARPWPASRTSRRSRRTLPRAPASPCPDTCRCIRASRRRWRP